MNRSEALGRLGQIAWRAITAEEYAEIVDALRRPATDPHRPTTEERTKGTRP